MPSLLAICYRQNIEAIKLLLFDDVTVLAKDMQGKNALQLKRLRRKTEFIIYSKAYLLMYTNSVPLILNDIKNILITI